MTNTLIYPTSAVYSTVYNSFKHDLQILFNVHRQSDGVRVTIYFCVSFPGFKVHNRLAVEWMNVTQAETRLAVKFPALIASTRHRVLPPVRTSVYTRRCSDYNPHAHPNDGNPKETGIPVRKNITPAWYSISRMFNHLKSKRRLLYLKTQFVPRRKHFSSRL